MRGLLLYCGAQRTWRWTSSGPQLQNARKPTISHPDEAYTDICAGVDRESLRVFYGNPYEVVASCIRNFIKPHQGKMLALDLSNIESRVSCFLAGCDHELDHYRHNRDAYKQLAADVFNVPVEKVTKEQRFVGKVGTLSLCFQTGAKTFWETCAAWGMPIDKKTAARTVKVFRETKPEFPKTWRAYESAMVKAINSPGKWTDATPHVSFARSIKEPFDRLLMRLPSGRSIVLPLPRVERKIQRHKDFETGETREWETDVVSFYGSLRGHAGWGRVQTYAGDAFQTSVQALARDIMLHGCLQAEKKGYEIFNLVHDEAHAHDGDLDGFIKAFTTLPDWLPEDFPLACAADRVDYYSKD
jgi:DNA polymerase